METSGLKMHSNVSLSNMVDYLNAHSNQSQSYTVIADHLLKIANVPVRNFLLYVMIPKLVEGEIMRTFKVMPRAQNAHTYVSAGFRAKVRPAGESQLLETISIVYTRISKNFIHTSNTERYLQERDITSEVTLQGALETLDKELVPDVDDLLLASVQYRKNSASGLFYKVNT
nr:PREDICTED: uncharacterized protein LOC106703574 [Latimeria chalumnae]|eukprot:XP_014344222.1 PREDICTED: uncharacterized protein LOC106703574 [Latimeria chalumnae]